ncbi:hypothetical protein SE17_27050 [Kouleothrix aurantiaca]|uniref:Uncharacterized protein n=1 Tax=Kouleothrix aurantiaca TaxID=186479 RepID=A0A0P9FCI1_9CHLR|nr:hypothetical protein SE17_27050 [Kouleothrix aurantiaca]
MTEATPTLTPDAIQLMNWLASAKDASASAGTQLHGPGGLLATPGLQKRIVNAMIMPRGLSGRLPVRPSVETNEIFGILTGLTASTGTEPTAACTDWPLVGQFKLCKQQHPFGQQGRMSQVLNIKYAGQVTNRGEFTDNVLFGQPNMGENVPPAAIDWGRALQDEAENKLAALYAGYFRDYARYIYTGNPQTTAGSAGWQQYRGLDLLIGTGKRDAISGVACPAADSIVIDMAGVNVNSNGNTFYNVIANVVTNLRRLSEQLGLEVKWALTMRYGAFWALTNIWPCVYATVGCNPTTLVRSAAASEMTRRRDEMRTGKYLLIEGEKIEVIVDDMIVEDPAAGGVVGTYESDIYFVPLTANGEPVLFWEYFPFNGAAINAASKLAPGGYFSVLQNGRFLQVRQSPTHTCVQVEIIERPRLILLTPFLAARFLNVRYTISVHERDAFPTETYFVNGGGTATPLPYFYPQSGSNG